ncbi:MAG: hypothetical protein ACI9OJ_002392 [Myxococcota bacterium]
MARDARQLLKPEALARLKSLQLRARGVVDGVLTGLHRSPHHGASVEFAEHKEYAPGDEIRHVDWKVFGKSDKYYIRRYEQETNLQAMLLVDASASMLYQSEAAIASKWDYACDLAASLSYLLLRQQDAVGLTVVDDKVNVYVPPRSRSTHLMNVCELLVRATPKAGRQTKLAAGVKHLTEVFTRRGLVYVISDFLDTDSDWFKVLRQLRGRRQQVTLLHLVDPWELTFPFDDMTIFRSLESGTELLAEPRVMREAYLREFRRFTSELRTSALADGMEYRMIRTDASLEASLTSLLAPGGTDETSMEPDGI